MKEPDSINMEDTLRNGQWTFCVLEMVRLALSFIIYYKPQKCIIIINLLRIHS